ncbi:MAG: TIGR02206 family membrane protein [Saprospiraceae bacterium]|nr:TIGR02206 family membrane protein [Saprospiraceae bacterium]
MSNNISPFFDFNTDFILYGVQHNTVIILIICLSIGLPIVTKRYFNPNQQLLISRIMAICIFVWVILYVFILFYLGKFNYKTDLPLDICNIIGLLVPFLMWNPNSRIFPYLYFYIMAGTTQAVFTPHLFDGFPNFIFIKYWVVHGGLIIYILYVAIIWKFQLNLMDLWRSFLFIQIYVLLVYLINILIGANYVYLVKPPTYSILDYFGPWPVYIFVCEVILLFLCFMVYLPYMKSQEEKKIS